MTVEVFVLGEVQVKFDGQPVRLGHARQRCVLAVFAMDAGRLVSVDHLVDRVWGDQPPGDARNVLYSYIARLRRLLADVATVERRPGGYLLAVDPLAVDVHRFRRLLRDAREARDDNAARALGERALALWRGEPFAGLASPWLDGLRVTLNQERWTADLDHADLCLRLGEHARLLPELSMRAAEHPLDERVAGQLMLALHRAGRTGDALRHYQDLRQRLVAELGIDPEPELRRLHQQILSADSTVVAGAASAPAILPRQLPMAPMPFIGRHTELARLSISDDSGATPAITVIVGPGGVGKTWLALHWAHHHVAEFPDGQLHVNLRGFDPTGQPVSANAVLKEFLDALGVPPSVQPADPDARAALFRSVVAGRRMLVVLDNARDADHVLPLLPGTATCTVLITSRRRLSGVITTYGARLLPLDVLSDAEARDVLVRHLGGERVAAEPGVAGELLATCAGLPLALGITAARAAAHPDFPLRVLVQEHRDSAAPLDALDIGDLRGNLRAVLACSCRALSTATSTMFGLMGRAPGPDIGLPAAASLAAVGSVQARTILRELETASLVQQYLPGRYRMHDLTRLYATEHADDRIPADVQAAALRRVVDFYLHTANACDALLVPHRERMTLDPPVSGCRPERPSERAAAVRWFDAEHPNLLAAQQLAVDRGLHAPVWQLARALNYFHERRYQVQDKLVSWRAALTAAELSGDPAVVTMARTFLGRACEWAGLMTEAATHLRIALSSAQLRDDLRGQAAAHFATAGLCEETGDDRRALEHSQHAMRLYRALNDSGLVITVFADLAWLKARLGDYDEAREAAARTLVLAYEHGYDTVVAAIQDTLGYVAHHTGEYAAALKYYGQALAWFRAIGSATVEADIHCNLGDAHAARGDRAEAHAAWRQALALYQTQHRDADAERVRDRLAGD